MSFETRAVESKDVPILSRLLFDAFARSPFFMWTFDTTDREHVLTDYFESVLHSSIQTGEAFVTAGLEGLAIWEGLKTDAPRAQATSSSRPINYVQAISILKRFRPIEPHVYLSILATAPREQRRGVARALICPVLDDLSYRGFDVYLETDREENLGFYRGLGFEITRQIQLGAGPLMWGMKRGCSRAAQSS